MMKARSLTLFLLLLLCGSMQLNAQKDSTFKKWRYVRIGVDLASVLGSFLSDENNRTEFQLDIAWKPDINLVAEFGFGDARVENENLRYKSSNQFIRLGLDKNFFNREFKGDKDNAFVGLRYGISAVKRQSATYFITDPIWGNTEGILPAEKFTAHWLELTGGFRMEIMKNIFAGWNVRAKTFLNPARFKELPPGYLAGFGRADQNTAFGFHFYLLYGFGKR